MFKKIFKNTTTKGKDRADSYEERGHSQGSTASEGFEGRPFEININAIWNYDHDELCEFIQKYESYTTSLAGKYNELIQGHVVAKEKSELLERERKRLLQENEQQKIYIDNLKQSLNEQSLSEPSSSSLRVATTTPSEKRQIEELIKEKVKIKGIDVGLLDEVRISGEKIIGQLNEVRSLMQPNNNENQQESENNENGEEGEAKINLTVNKSFKESLNQIIEDLEMTLQLILPKFLSVNERLRQREKEIGDSIKGDFLDALRQLDEGFTDRVSSEQVAELESKANDLRHKLIKAESALSEKGTEINAKNEQLEKARKAQEATQMELKRTQQLIDEQIEASQAEIEQLTKKINSLEEKVRSSEYEIKTLRSERSTSELEAEKIIENNRLLNEVSEKSEEEKSNKINELLKEKSALEGEKAKLSKKISDIDQEKNDIENKLIQEKLKHHQTQSDLLKIKETFEQTQKDLNEEIESRKDDLRKIEELKRQLIESDKKSKEYKKSMKRLSQQIVDLQNKIHAENKEKEKEKELNTEASVPELTTPDRIETETMPTNDDLFEKTQIINEQYRKIQELRDELEKALHETSNLKKEFALMRQKKEELETQGKVLHEKREKGLQEISRLTAVIDDIKAKNPGISIPQQRPIVPPQYSQKATNPIEENKRTIVKGHQHSQSISGNKPISIQKQANDYIKVMKSNLNLLYKEVILAITNEKVLETDRGSRVSSRLDTGNSVTDSSISESLVRIEKKVNDVMLLLQEYTESIE